MIRNERKNFDRNKRRLQKSHERKQELKMKKHKEMQKYREKVRKSKEIEKGSDVSETASNVQVNGKRNKLVLQKKLAVKRTQEWRMKIRLKNFDSRSDQQASQPTHDAENGFTSKFSKCRKIKKVKAVLPSTPKKKAEVIKHLIDSPATSHILTEENVILSPECRKKLEVADAIVDSVTESLGEVKVVTSKESQKKHAYKVVCAAILKKGTKRKALVKRVLNLSYRARQMKREWWKKARRKKRKDALSDEIKVSKKFLSQF